MQKNSVGRIRTETILAILLILSILLMIFTKVLDSRDVRGYGNRVILSLQREFGVLVEGIKEGFSSLLQLREIHKQYEIARESLSKYQGMERELLKLHRENSELREQIGLSENIQYKQISARVIAGDPSNLFSSITLDKGAKDGIRKGMGVSAFQNSYFGLLGKVVAVASDSCQVRPITDPDNYVAARLEKSRSEGLVHGRGNANGELLMKYVRKDMGNKIALDELVITSGMRSIYPPSISIGRVKEIRSQEYSTSLNIIVQPIVDVKRVEYVVILGEYK